MLLARNIYGYMDNMIKKNSRLFFILIIAISLLLVPLIAMQFTNEVAWDWFDFFVAGFLLFGAGIAVEMALRLVTQLRYRVVLIGVVFFVLSVIWVEMAVGILGTPIAGS